VADSLSWGRRFRILCIADDFTREALALVVDTSIGGQRMARDRSAGHLCPVVADDHGRQRASGDQPVHGPTAPA